MNCETSYTSCCQIEAEKSSKDIKLSISQLAQYIGNLVIVGAEDMSKTK